MGRYKSTELWKAIQNLEKKRIFVGFEFCQFILTSKFLMVSLTFDATELSV